jgi:hypothetical protein
MPQRRRLSFPAARALYGARGLHARVWGGRSWPLPSRSFRGTRWGQALICLRSVSVLAVMVILRGFAFSAIGIRRVSTPAS